MTQNRKGRQQKERQRFSSFEFCFFCFFFWRVVVGLLVAEKRDELTFKNGSVGGQSQSFV